MKNFFVNGLLIIAIALVLAGCPDDYYTSGAGGEPNTPTGLVATPISSTSIVISWPMVTGALHYCVYRSENASNTYTYIGVALPTDTGISSYTATGLSGGTTYYFKVSAVNSAGESSQSSSVSASTLIGTPTSVSATATSSSSITVSWSAVSGATGYYVYNYSAVSGTSTRLGTVLTSDRSYTITGLSPGTLYYYRVSAYNSNGEGDQSSYVYATTPSLNTPTNVSATAGSSYNITVSWSAVSGATGYYVYYSTSASGTYSRLTSTSSTSYLAQLNGTYYFKVSAYNSGGESLQSSYVSATGYQ